MVSRKRRGGFGVEVNFNVNFNFEKRDIEE